MIEINENKKYIILYIFFMIFCEIILYSVSRNRKETTNKGLSKENAEYMLSSKDLKANESTIEQKCKDNPQIMLYLNNSKENQSVLEGENNNLCTPYPDFSDIEQTKESGINISDQFYVHLVTNPTENAIINQENIGYNEDQLNPESEESSGEKDCDDIDSEKEISQNSETSESDDRTEEKVEYRFLFFKKGKKNIQPINSLENISVIQKLTNFSFKSIIIFSTKFFSIITGILVFYYYVIFGF